MWRDRRALGARLVRGECTGWPARLARLMLRPLSWAYGLGVALRSLAYRWGILRSRRLPGPVISLGNVTAGGTGKTPFAEWLVGRLREAGRRPAVLSRGYGAPRKGEPNDEARMLARNVPGLIQIVGPDRVRGGWEAFEERKADCVVLDDGFQHLRLHRDLDIVLIDALDPVGGGRLLPAGCLREPLRGLRRADVLVLTRADMVEAAVRARIVALLRDCAPRAEIVQAEVRPVALEPVGRGAPREPAWLGGRRVFAFCGLGNPRAFVRSLQRLGPASLDGVLLDDHAPYPAALLAELAREAEAGAAEAAVTTQKDAVKIGDSWPGEVPAFALRVDVRVVEGEELLMERLHGLFPSA